MPTLFDETLLLARSGDIAARVQLRELLKQRSVDDVIAGSPFRWAA